jgi:FHS family L-fucose permease-like MFS transporter
MSNFSLHKPSRVEHFRRAPAKGAAETQNNLVSQAPSKPEVVPKKYLAAFILTTCCFALWGFANDVTNPLVKVFKEVFLINNAESSLVQTAFYGGYFTMALPAAFFIRKYSYKAAIMIGFALYAIGAFLSLPASLAANFYFFILGLYILTFGLAFLETACNPYIMAMGPPETATQRLNLAQAFNPIGTLTGMLVMTSLIAPNLVVTNFREEVKEQKVEATRYLYTDASQLPEGAELKDEKITLTDGSEVTFYKDGLPDHQKTFGKLDGNVTDALTAMRATEPEKFSELQQSDLGYVRLPYLAIGGVVLGFLILFFLTKMPSFKDDTEKSSFLGVCKRIWKRPHFREGVMAQGFYVGAQITCWTFVIHYGMEVAQLDLKTAGLWNVAAMVTFLSCRFICTALMRKLSPGWLMGVLAVVAVFLLLGAIFLDKKAGLTCLVAVSACMSLMFPTIYGIALRGLSPEEAEIGSAFLIMAIVGGAVLPLMQGKFIDELGIKNSFWLPVVCFVVIAIYGFRAFRKFEKEPA